MPMKNQKMIIIGGVVLLLVIAGGAGAWMKFKSKPTETQTQDQKKRKVSEPVNAISVTERPYVKLIPNADGRHIDIQVVTLKKPATEMEYEFEYQSGSLLQAAFDTLTLSSIPATAQIKLYSCSAGGACTYHKEIKGGNALLKFKGETNYALKSDWRYFDALSKDPQLSSKDAKFQLSADGLKKAGLAIVYNTPGYPEGLTGTPISDFYSLVTSGALTGKGELTMRANEEGASSIMGYNGKAWQELTSKVDGKTVTATVDLMELYVVVKK
jgi:hypothetical protein